MKLFVLLAAGVLLFPALLCHPAAAQRSLAEQYLFQAANAERSQRGLPALHWDDALYRAAVNHAIEMARRRSISHQYPGEAELSARGQQAGAHFSVIAENVAEAPSAARIHDAWMNSQGHRENLLDPRVDSVAISVIMRDGQLYAVQDFDKSVAALSFDEQENAVAHLLAAVAPVQIVEDSSAARRTCEMNSGYAGQQRPYYTMRFTASELNHLPNALRTQLATGKYSHAAVGACEARDQQSFTAYNIAVLLYP
jgi:hypothetical protein